MHLYAKKYNNLQLKFRTNKNYHEYRPLVLHSVISALLKPLQAAPHRNHFVQAFEIALFSIRSVKFKFYYTFC